MVQVASNNSDALDSWLEALPAPLVLDMNRSEPVLPHILSLHMGWAWVVALLYQPFSQVMPLHSHDGYQSIGTVALTVRDGLATS